MISKKYILIAMAIAIVAASVIAYYFIFRQNGPMQISACGDGTCDPAEKRTGFCPADCSDEAAVTTGSGATANQGAGTASVNQESGTASVKIDAANSLGKFSPYLFGTIDADKNNGQGKLGFKVMEIMTANDKAKRNPLEEPCSPTSFDADIDTIFAAGAEPLMFFHVNGKPKDMKKFSDCVTKVAIHLKDKKVKLIRFGNEPDGKWQEWSKYPALDFYETYAAFAKAVKAVDRNFILDAPGVMTVTANENTDGGMSLAASDANFSTELSSWAKDFLDYLDQNRVPLDVFSFHIYSPMPYVFYQRFEMVGSKLKDYPNIESIYEDGPRLGNDEWHIALGDFWSGMYSEFFDKTWAAANNIVALINMIEQNVYLSVNYAPAATGERGCHDFLSTSCSGKAKPQYYAYQAFNQLSGADRLMTSGTDRMNFAAISGMKEKNGDKQILIVLANYDVKKFIDTYSQHSGPGGIENPDKQTYNNYVKNKNNGKVPAVYDRFEIKVNNVPWRPSDQIVARRYVIDDNHKFELVESLADSGTIGVLSDRAGGFSVFIKADMDAPQVQVIALSLKGVTSLFSLSPALAADDNYGERDALGKAGARESSGTAPSTPPSPQAPQTGKCGDGTCDQVEKTSGLCLADCGR